jgi:hypothetical protein
MVFAGVLDWPVVYVEALVVTLVTVALLYRYNRLAGTAAFRVVVWSLAAGLGIGSAYLLIVDSSGFSYGGFDALLVISALASIPAFGVVALAVVALRIFSNRGFEALERMPLIVVAIAVLMIGAVGTFVAILRSFSGR